jgi:flagellar hook-associated protein 1 FlgK
MSDLMRIGSSAMNAAYAQLQTTGQNIANAATPGYVRREVVLQEAGDNSPQGWTGRGVDAVAVRRIYDEFLVRESVATRAGAAQDAARGESLARLDRLFADGEGGLGAGFDDLVASFNDLSAKPADPSARSAVLARADAFASRAAVLDGRLVELRDAAQGQLQAEVQKANDTLASLALVNKRIGEARGASGEPNALLDQRDKLLADLNGTLRANATVGQDGTVTVTSQRGEPLVVGPAASRLSVSADALDPSKLSISVVRGNGVTLPMEGTEVGGRLAGLMRFATQDVDAARYEVGRLVASVAGAINGLQSRGLDATGQAGQPMFALGAPVATGAPANTGTGRFAVAVADPSALKASDYELSWDGTQYSLRRLSDNAVQTLSGLPATVEGLQLSSAGGTPAAGDRFLIRSASAFAAGARSLLTNPDRIATAVPVAAETGASNAGDVRAASLDVTSIVPATTATVTITFTGPNTFDVVGPGTGNPTGLSYSPGMTLAFNGWSTTLAGTPAAGDTLRIAQTASPAADNRNARAMQALGDAAIADGQKVIDRYAALVGDIGTRTQSARTAGEMSQRIHEDAERARTEMSGVNLDEEAARLLQYQQAYQAAAKVVATANEMFRSLLQAAG